MFSPISVDNFFEHPDQVVEFSKTVDFSNSDGSYPGQRSQDFGTIAPKIKDYIVLKVLSQYMPISEINAYQATACFQKVSSNYGEGWIHSDESMLSVIIYLNKENNLGRGTSIFRPSKMNPFYNSNKEKFKFYEQHVVSDDYENQRLSNNEFFQETIRYENVYNRAVAFEGIEYHRANNFIPQTNQEDRLTIVCFIFDIIGSRDSFPESRFSKVGFAV